MGNGLRDKDAHESSVELVVAFVDGGDSAAATRIYYRHRESTLRLARNRMSRPLQQRIDAEDVYQSVSVILLDGLKEGRFQIQQAGDLRALIAQLTRQRILKKAEQHSAAKRAVDRESVLMPYDHLRTNDMLPDERAEQCDVIDYLLEQTANPRHRQVIRMALDGAEVPEVAQRTGYSQARVRQILDSLAARAQRDHSCYDS